MKQDIKSFSALQAKAEHLAALKYDTLVPANELVFSCHANTPSLKVEGKEYPLLERAQRHIAELVQMPFGYFSRLRDEHPELLAYNINSLFPFCDSTTPRLIRTLNGKCRCIASNKYKLLEHENVLSSIAPLIAKYHLEVAACGIDDDRMRIKLISRKTKVTPVVGTTVCFGVFIQNSETTASSLFCTPYAEKLQCTNGLVLPQYFATSRKIHRGAAIWDMDEYTMPDMSYIVEHVNESIETCLDSSNHSKVLNAIRMASELQLADPVKSVQATAQKLKLTPAEQGQALLNLVESKDFTMLGLSDAITKAGETALSMERATYLETVGASILFEPVADAYNEQIMLSAA